MNHKYNGFEEIAANTPQEAIKEVQEFDYQTGDMTTYTYEVDCLDWLSVETRDLISCLGKGGNLPTDEISQHFNLERKVIYYDNNDKRTGNP